MKRITITAAALPACAWADKYGVNEAMADGSGDFGNALLGALIIAVAWLIWKKFFG